MSVTYPLTVFYDGACGVCSSEMIYYKSIADQRIKFINIAEEGFCAEEYGITESDFQRALHVRDAKGQYYTGVEAFQKLWEALPSPFFPRLSSLVGLPGIYQIACAGYAVFAKFRHLLPKSKNSCHLS